VAVYWAAWCELKLLYPVLVGFVLCVEGGCGVGDIRRVEFGIEVSHEESGGFVLVEEGGEVCV
jgi:hypothetical protein